MIELKSVCKRFVQNKSDSVDHVSLSIPSRQTMILLGSSGSGKTTILKMINRLESISAGDILIDGESIQSIAPRELRKKIGYVFQRFGLFPHMTVLGNMTLQLKLLGLSKQARNKRAYELLEFINLNPKEFAKRFPDELSGGQQQRIGVARALMTDPDILLMDEPFGAIDAINRDNLQKELQLLIKTLGKTVVFVTHDIFEAFRLGDQIAVMHKGRLQQVGSPQDLLHSKQNPFVIDMMNKVKAQVATFQQAYQVGDHDA